MKLGRNKLWASVLFNLVAAALIYWMVQGIDWATAWVAYQRVPAHVWLTSALGVALSHLLRAGRVRAEWRMRLRMGWREAWGLMVRHSAWVVLLPMRSGEAIYVWALHRQGGISLREASISLLKLRVQDMAVLAALSLALFAPLGVIHSLLLAVLCMALTIWVMPRVWRELMRRLFQRTHEPTTQAGAPAWQSWVYATTNWLVKTCAIAWPLWVMLPVSFRSALQGSVAAELASALPLQPPAGFGPYEAGVIVGVQWSTPLSWPDIAAAGLAIHVLGLVVTVTSAVLARLLGWSHRPLRQPIQQQVQQP